MTKPAPPKIDLDAPLVVMEGLDELARHFDALVTEATAMGAAVQPDRIAALARQLEQQRAAHKHVADRWSAGLPGTTKAELDAARAAVDATLAELGALEAAQDPAAARSLLGRAREEVITPAEALVQRALVEGLAATIAGDIAHAAQVATIVAQLPVDVLEAFVVGAVRGGRRRDAAVSLAAWLRGRPIGPDVAAFTRGWLREAAAMFLGETPFRVVERLVTGERALREATKHSERRHAFSSDDYRTGRTAQLYARGTTH